MKHHEQLWFPVEFPNKTNPPLIWCHSDRHGPRLGESCRAQPKIRDWAHCFNGAAKGFSGLEMHSWNRSQRCVSVSHRIFCEESDEFVELKGTGQLKHIN